MRVSFFLRFLSRSRARSLCFSLSSSRLLLIAMSCEHFYTGYIASAFLFVLLYGLSFLSHLFIRFLLLALFVASLFSLALRYPFPFFLFSFHCGRVSAKWDLKIKQSNVILSSSKKGYKQLTLPLRINKMKKKNFLRNCVLIFFALRTQFLTHALTLSIF